MRHRLCVVYLSLSACALATLNAATSNLQPPSHSLIGPFNVGDLLRKEFIGPLPSLCGLDDPKLFRTLDFYVIDRDGTQNVSPIVLCSPGSRSEVTRSKCVMSLEGIEITELDKNSQSLSSSPVNNARRVKLRFTFSSEPDPARSKFEFDVYLRYDFVGNHEFSSIRKLPYQLKGAGQM